MSTTSKPSSGWNRSSSTPKPAPKKPSALRGVVAGLVVVALAAACVFFFMGKGDKPVEKAGKKPVKIKEVTPAPVKKTVETPPVETQQPKPKCLYTYMGKSIVSESAVTNGPVVVTTMVDENGEKYQKVGRVTRQIFDTNIDRRIAGVISEEPGRRMAPLPPANPNADAEFLKAIEKPIVVTKDDSPEDAALKRAVIAARLQIKEAMDAGEHFNDILAKHHEWHNANIELSAEADDAYRKLLKEGATEEAEAYKAKANEVLEKAGARTISGPKQKKKTSDQ